MTSAGSAHLRSEYDRLTEEFERCLAEVFAVAEVAATERAQQWRAIVVATAGDEQPAGPPAGKGANAAEVRSVLIAIERTYDRRLALLERALRGNPDGLDALEDEMWEFRNRRLSDFVRVEVAAYVKRVAPRPSVGNVFAAAANKQRARAAATVAEPGAHVQMITCNTCAAPRLQDVLYASCAFCGEPFFRT